MKRIFFLLLVVFLANVVFSQDSLSISTQPTLNPNKNPEKVEEINFGPELKAQYTQRGLIYDKINSDPQANYEPSREEQIILENLDETREDQWDVVGGGCSWYCGAGDWTVTASSELMSKSESISYVAKNAFDLNFKSAWVEGVKGYGIGEALTYSFPAKHPRITSIIIANGYVKSEAAYKNNSRVKALAVYYNDKKLAILHLKDIRGKQSFSFSPIGNTRTESYNAETSSWHTDIDFEAGDWKLKFEILEVYKGYIYDDTVISELYFDGIDVH